MAKFPPEQRRALGGMLRLIADDIETDRGSVEKMLLSMDGGAGFSVVYLELKTVRVTAP